MTLPTIVVDSRGAGEGKTTTGIYLLLKIANRVLDTPTLLVVPSIRLQEQYLRDMPELIRDGDVINSDRVSNVSAALIQRLKEPYWGDRPRVVMITHEAFRRTEIPRTLRGCWNLVIDEVMDPWSYEKITLETARSWQPHFHFGDLFRWRKPHAVIPGDTEEFYELLVGKTPDTMIFSDSPQWQRLTSTNHRLWMREPAYQRLCQNHTGYSELVISLHQSVFEDWVAINIAAAAFEYTFMAHWFRVAGFQVEYAHAFERQDRNIHIHTMKLPDGMRWSNNKRIQFPEILDDYHSYVNQNLPKPILAVRNNAESRALVNEVRLGHNAHGMNNYTEYQAISLETALIVNPTLNEFYTRQLMMTPRQVVAAFSSYTFYQLIMRTRLRLKNNQDPVHVAILDYETLVELGNFLAWPVAQTYDEITTRWQPPPQKQRGGRRPRGQRAMTGAERARLHRQRQQEAAQQLFEQIRDDIK